MRFEDLIQAVGQPGASKEVALRVLRESREPANALKLFAAACEVRDRALGTKLWWSAGISAVLPCRVVPRCAYCTYFTAKSFPIEELVAGAKAIEQIGIRHLHLSGGTDLAGYDAEMIAMVTAIRAASDIEIEVNLGPSFSQDGVRQLKALGVRSVTSSLEVFNPEIFAKAKPGDSLEGRKRLVEICQEEQMSVRSMILIGLGETDQDRIDHLFYLKGFSRLYHLRFSRFQPYQTTAYRDHPRCSPWETARLIAVARLLMPEVDLGLAAGNSADDIPLWYSAGGGNQLLGAAISLREPKTAATPGEDIIQVTERVSLVSKMKQLERYVAGFGRSVGAQFPPL